MNTELLRRFIQLIAVHTGIGVREEEANKLVGTIRSRAASLQRTPEAYYRLLALDADAGRHEWEELSQLLTIGESYFFRDSGQFTLLRQRILPELIERNSLTSALRIWSAGCSTGEEPYSLAILLHELLPIKHEWDVVILGTDLNNHAIAAARRGMTDITRYVRSMKLSGSVTFVDMGKLGNSMDVFDRWSTFAK